MSFTITLTGVSSDLRANFLPPIELNDEYTIGMLSFDSYNTIPNIIKGVNDMFYFGDTAIQIPEGSYDIDAINEYLEEQIGHVDPQDGIVVRGNTSTLRSEIRCTKPVYFNHPDKQNSIGPLLGFVQANTTIQPTHHYAVSDDIVKIFNVNVISIQCNIASGSYVNGQLDHCIHQFFPAVEPGYKLIETPNPVIYLPVNTRTIENIVIRIVDQNGELINFRGETIVIRLHLRRNGD